VSSNLDAKKKLAASSYSFVSVPVGLRSSFCILGTIFDINEINNNATKMQKYFLVSLALKNVMCASVKTIPLYINKRSKAMVITGNAAIIKLINTLSQNLLKSPNNRDNICLFT